MIGAGRFALLAVSLGAALLFGSTGAARAQNCTAAVDTLAFGAIDTLTGGSVDAATNVTITCQSPAAVCANINAGPAGTATDGSRLLTSTTGQTLRLQLYQDAARLVPWGSLENAALGAPPRIVVPNGNTPVTVPLYARIFGGQSAVATGTYSAVFSGAQTPFYYGGISLGCGLVLLPAVTRPAFEANAQVASNCLVEADDLDFGSSGLLGTALTAATRLRVRCTPGAPYSISLGGGSAEATGLPRRMTRPGGPGEAQYALFRDEARQLPWSTSAPVQGVGDGVPQTVPVYGLVPPQPTPPAGRYTDVVVVTVTH